MNFQELVSSLLAEKKEVSEFPIEVKANGYTGVIYKPRVNSKGSVFYILGLSESRRIFSPSDETQP